MRAQHLFHHLAAVLLVAFLLVPAAYGQIGGGLRLGMTGSSFSGETDSDFSAVVRMAGGVHLSMRYQAGFVFEPGVQYAIKGGQADAEIDGIPIEATWDLAYLEFPLIVAYVFETRHSLHPKLFAGPVMSFSLDAQISYRAKSGGPKFQSTDDSIQNRDLGVAAGLGVEFDIGSERLQVGAQTTFGLSNVRSADPEFHNRSVFVFAGIIF